MKTGSRPEEQKRLEDYYRDQDKALMRALLFIGGFIVTVVVLALRFGGK